MTTEVRETMTLLRALAPAAAAALILSGCSGPAGPAGCELDLELSNAESGVSATLTEAVAISVADGAGYTVFASDFPFGEEVSAFFDPDVPDGGNLAWISLAVFNAEGDVLPIEEGQVIPAGTQSGEHVLVVVHAAADAEYGQNAGVTGQATVTGVGDRLCAEIEYEDDQKSLTGTIGVDVAVRG